jgi:hypothetical protein
MISQQSFGGSDLPFPKTQAKDVPLEHTTLPAEALFSTQFLSRLSRQDPCESGQCTLPAGHLRQIATVADLALDLTAVRNDAPHLISHMTWRHAVMIRKPRAYTHVLSILGIS